MGKQLFFYFVVIPALLFSLIGGIFYFKNLFNSSGDTKRELEDTNKFVSSLISKDKKTEEAEKASGSATKKETAQATTAQQSTAQQKAAQKSTSTQAPSQSLQESPENSKEQELAKLDYWEKYKTATIKTNKGDIKVKFFGSDAKITVNNFIKLSNDGFYNNTKFHRVIKDFMIQGGDPNSKEEPWDDDGKGGPGYSFKDEINSHKLVRGALAMANSGANTNGSQFFILTAKEKPDLDGKHTVFGEVISGMNVVDEIEKVETDKSEHPDHPKEDVTIRSIEVSEN